MRASNGVVLVRLFDKDGKYITHFTTKEKFTFDTKLADTMNEGYENHRRGGFTPEESGIFRHVVIKGKGNSLSYPVKQVDLKRAVNAEVGFWVEK